MKYKVESNDDTLDIEVTAARENQDKLLQAFNECREGRCSCPTREYSKLDSMEIASNEDKISLKLKSKPGLKFDESEIGKCLEYTRGKVMDES